GDHNKLYCGDVLLFGRRGVSSQIFLYFFLLDVIRFMKLLIRRLKHIAENKPSCITCYVQNVTRDEDKRLVPLDASVPQSQDQKKHRKGIRQRIP
ncbi:hypothetical protein X777_01638, partial [Ooceraea biroi]